MAVDQMLLQILVCPEDKSPVRLAEPAIVTSLNQLIEQGALTNRAGVAVKDKLDGGLIRADGKFLYPIREDIPIMLVEEAIELPRN